ncbi:MAG: hypothetical protein KBD06_05460 [Candidatus Pacebacteria bacterium]|nr:hypothetical protein [Candidatus Paceibacterota bacterium]
MVVQRTLNKIEELKERPHHERRAIAFYIAIGVVAFLILFWGFFVVRSLGSFALRLNTEPETAVVVQSGNVGSAASAAAAADSMMLGAPTQFTASSSNGRVELVPTR